VFNGTSTAIFLGILNNCTSEFAVLFGLSLAAHIFLRMNIINVALDGQILLSSAIYAVGVKAGMPFTGILFAIMTQMALSVGLVTANLRLGISDLMLSMGLYFLCLGAAPVICVLFGSPAASVILPVAGVAGRTYALLALAILTPLVIFLLHYIRLFRLAKVISDSKSVIWDRLSGLNHMMIASGTLAALLIAFSGFYLVEAGSGYAEQLTHHSGFLALAIASTSRRIIYLGVWSFVLAILFALAVSLNFDFLPKAMGGIEHILPFIFFLVVAVLRKRWARGQESALPDTSLFSIEINATNRTSP
jgi:hypothetical protein